MAAHDRRRRAARRRRERLTYTPITRGHTERSACLIRKVRNRLI